MPCVTTAVTVWRNPTITPRSGRSGAVCLGKKNYIFFGSDHGGERGALLYGLIGTCRLNGIDPEAYLRHILSVLPEWPSNRVGELLPWNVAIPA